MISDNNIIGYETIKKNNTSNINDFFLNAKISLISNIQSCDVIKNYPIKYLHGQTDGYINNGEYFKNDTNKIDITQKTYEIASYGTSYISYTHRNTIIEYLKNKYGDKYINYENLYGIELYEKLKYCKIIIHIPSYDNLPQIPYPKIFDTVLNDFFLIIEYCKEMEILNLKHIFPYYFFNSIEDNNIAWQLAYEKMQSQGKINN